MDFTVAIIFMGFCIFGPMLISVYEKPQKVKYIYVKQTKVKPKAKVKKVENVQPDIVYKSDQNLQMKEDCFECLRSLGMNKKDAKDKVNQMWKNKNYNSIESFLIDAYRV
jgi:Holliday junction resolvasome RuvABC DNA-binding subunit